MAQTLPRKNRILSRTSFREIRIICRTINIRDQHRTRSGLRGHFILSDPRLRSPTIGGIHVNSKFETTLPLGSTLSRDRDPRRWRYGIQRQYQRTKAVVNNRLKEAIKDRADQHNQDRDVLDVCSGSQVWLFLDRGKEGDAVRLAHMWHGPFQVIDKCEDHAVRM